MNDIWSQWQTWVAGYAAIVATGAFALEVRRWTESGVRLRIHLMPNAGEVVGGRISDKRRLVVTVANRGDRSTTITHLALADYSGNAFSYWWRRLRGKKTKAAIIPDAVVGMIIPGNQWQGYIDWTQLKPWVIDSKGKLFVEIYSSGADKPWTKAIPLSAALAGDKPTFSEVVGQAPINAPGVLGRR